MMADKVYMALSTGTEYTCIIALSPSLEKVREMTQDYMRENGKWVQIYPHGMWQGQGAPPEGTIDMFCRTDEGYMGKDMMKTEDIDIFERELD